MKTNLSLSLSVILFFLSTPLLASSFSIEDYNKSLIENGVAWKAGRTTYLPAFYTGFAPRIENAKRIHFQLSRGNQIRLTAPIDDFSVLTYLYGLKSREALVEDSSAKGLIKLDQQDQFGLFKSVLSSDLYSVNELIGQFDNGQISKPEFYAKSLNLIEQLNPGRVFRIQFNLTSYIERWKSTADRLCQKRKYQERRTREHS